MASKKKNQTKKRTAVMQSEAVTQEAMDLAAATLKGDVREVLLHNFKNAKKPWPALSQDEQEQIVENFDNQAEELIRNICDVIASKGQESILVTLSGVASKDSDIVAKIKTKKTPESWAAMGAVDGYPVTLIINSADQYMGQRGPAETQPDQNALFDRGEGGSPASGEGGGEE